MALLRLVSKAAACSALVPLLVETTISAGRLYLAETAFETTVNSWIESMGGCVLGEPFQRRSDTTAPSSTHSVASLNNPLRRSLSYPGTFPNIPLRLRPLTGNWLIRSLSNVVL